LFKKKEIDPDILIEERWTAHFSHPLKNRFLTEQGSTYSSDISKAGLVLKIYKDHTLAWISDPLYRYADQVLEGSLSILSAESYGAAGIQFRRIDDQSYYSFLISNKGFFRLDVLFNGTTMPLIGWTEIPDYNDKSQTVLWRIIALGDRITIILNNVWAGEITDETIPSGKLAFAAVCYDWQQASGLLGDELLHSRLSIEGLSVGNPPSGTLLEDKMSPDSQQGKHPTPICFTAVLRSLTVESRPIEVEAAHLRWNRLIPVPSSSRMRLAETFVAMNQHLSALVQIKRIWKTSGAVRNQDELLFAARCALQLSLFEEAEEYLDRCLEADVESDLSRMAMAEKAKLFYLQGRYADLLEHTKAALEFFPQDPVLHTLLAHAYLNLGRPDLAAASYTTALDLDPENGLIAQNAGSACEQLGQYAQAYIYYMKAGSCFLNQENYSDLSLLIPRILELGRDHPESHSLAGKLYYALEDYHRAEKELLLADSLQGEERHDPAIPYLLALLLIHKGKRKTAVPLLQRAVSEAPAEGLFHFRLAETLFVLHRNSAFEELHIHLAKAIELLPEDGWVHNLAAQVAMEAGEYDTARQHLETAARLLPKESAVRANQAELAFRSGHVDTALSLLKAPDIEDPNGILAHQSGLILAAIGAYEQAKPALQEAVYKSPRRIDFMLDLAACLIELGLYGEADDILAKAYEIEETPQVLEQIGYVAFKKGEFPRAEAAYRLGLEQDNGNSRLLQALAWLYITMGRWQQAEETVDSLETITAKSRQDQQILHDLKERILMGTTRVVSCARCDRSWRVRIDAPPSPPLRLVAEPPDDLPAGTCITCKTTYCIGCAKNSLDDSGRFVCPNCGERLKLYDEGLKKILTDWSASCKMNANPSK
ncbi:MAG: tetratricopeptide repeat protein, partial [Termitinemataceae bacterium]